MATLTNIGDLISIAERPCIAGTKISIQQIASLTNEGLSPNAIADEYPNLSMAQIHAALTYYYANQTAIDEAAMQEQRLHDQMAAAQRV